MGKSYARMKRVTSGGFNFDRTTTGDIGGAYERPPHFVWGHQKALCISKAGLSSALTGQITKHLSHQKSVVEPIEQLLNLFVDVLICVHEVLVRKGSGELHVKRLVNTIGVDKPLHAFVFINKPQG